MLDEKWKNHFMKDMTFVDFGYADINSHHWGHVK